MHTCGRANNYSIRTNSLFYIVSGVAKKRVNERDEGKDDGEGSEPGDQQGPSGGNPPTRRKREDPSAETMAAIAEMKKTAGYVGICKAMFGVRFG